MSEYQIDWDLISKLEGGNHHKGYHPTENSGVTIATGFDLKDKTPESLLKLGFSDSLIMKLTPYLGKTGAEASEMAGSLQIDDMDSKEINELSKMFYTNDIAKQFNLKSKDKKFKELTSSQQTIIASVGYQYGSLSRVPTFFGHVTEGNWTETINELNNFKDDFPTRRETEATYLKERQKPEQTYFYAKEPVEEPKFYAKEPEEEPKFYAKEE